VITLIEALNYRCLRYIRQPVGAFEVLVGPNATGKTTFLDVIAFLSDVVCSGVESAIAGRTSNPEDLIWLRQGTTFELAIEVAIPEKLRSKLANPTFDRLRYELAVGMDVEGQGVGLSVERVLLKKESFTNEPVRLFFPQWIDSPPSILSQKGKRKTVQSIVVSKEKGGNDNYYAETAKGYNPSYRTNPRRSALANLPADELSFPVSTWFKEFLSEGIQQFILNSLLIRKASPPGQIKGFKPDGSNLPWVVAGLANADPDRFRDWIEHLKTALPDIENIRTVERLDDKHRYLILRFSSGLEVPSWMASDGTLRLLALTLPAYLSDFQGCYVIEEPENGIHPRAVETVLQSLSSIYDAQVLLATHSPVILGNVEPKDVLCFTKTEDGATDIVTGDKHPKLSDWRGSPNLSVLFAGGVLG
jgi:predicted ATPase